MDFRAGDRVGAFEILGPLGAGGMGEVFRARDSRLGREVALKVLPRVLSQDPERLARFDREARVLASLNHPGIGSIYGIEDSPRGSLLVLELVPGETLADRISRGPVPVAETISICRQIADAVAFAHANGIVHRDLKPANVKCTPQGVVKVLDFGLAKALAPDAAVGSGDPTVTPATTQDGAIIGTPAYMSPEQARAKDIDRRTDIWSFGCILYELLAGRRAFQRETLTDTLVAVLGEEPDWTRLPPGTPSAVRAILRRCLQRDRDRRLHDMADVRIELDEALAPSDVAQAPASRPQPWGLRPFEWLAAGVIVLAALTHAAFLYRLVPSLAAMAAGFGMELSLPLRLYIGLSNLSVRIVPLLFVAWGLWRLSGGRVAPAVRSAALIVGAALSVVTTIGGLYFIAEDGMVQAMRLVVGAPSQGLQRDLIVLHFAAGDPARVIAILDPRGNRDDFARSVTWASPVQAFQLAEAYRAVGNADAARRLYRRAQEAAVKFDEVLAEQMQRRQVQWQVAFGRNVTEWAPTTADMRRLPDLVRTLSQQRLDSLTPAR
jgi:hypothetical protein